MSYFDNFIHVYGCNVTDRLTQLSCPDGGGTPMYMTRGINRGYGILILYDIQYIFTLNSAKTKKQRLSPMVLANVRKQGVQIEVS